MIIKSSATVSPEKLNAFITHINNGHSSVSAVFTRGNYMYQILSPSAVGLLAALFVLPVFADDDDHKKKLAINEVEGELSVMVLGSGGPVATAAGRARASYLIFTNGHFAMPNGDERYLHLFVMAITLGWCNLPFYSLSAANCCSIRSNSSAVDRAIPSNTSAFSNCTARSAESASRPRL